MEENEGPRITTPGFGLHSRRIKGEYIRNLSAYVHVSLWPIRHLFYNRAFETKRGSSDTA